MGVRLTTHFTCIGRGHGAPCLPATREEWEKMRREPWLTEMCKRIEKGDDELKHRLPVWTPSCAEFKDNHRAAADALKPLNRLMMDFDEKGHTDEIVEKLKDAAAPDISGMKILLVEESARRGTHVLVELPAGMDAETAQQLMKDATGFKPDKQVKGVDRCIYMVPESHTRFVSEKLFEPSIISAESSFSLKENSVDPCQKEFPDSYHGIPFERILKKYWEMNNGGFEPNVGDRDTLTFQLASDLRHICGRSAEWLDQVIPCYDGFPIEEKRQKIANALKSSYEGMPGRLKTVLDALEGRTPEKESPQPTYTLDPSEPSSELSKIFASKTPPAIPDKRPKLVDAVLCNTPQKYKATVAQAMFPGLMAYPKNLSFVYIDNQVRELRANCLIVAGTGSGKDSCTKQPLAHLIADMKARDEENRRRLKEFNDEYNSKAANKQKPQRPADLIIQTIKSDITKAALVQRMDEAQGAPLYVRINELEQWDKIEGASGRGNQFTTLKLCDDEGNDYGTDRAGTQGVTGAGSLHLNWNANTTTAKAIKYFRYVLTDGPISRLCLATIPEEEVGAEISVFGTYGEKYDAALKPYIENLKAATGVIDCKEAKKLARKLKDECADFARLSQDRVFDNLSHRALVIAFRKACMLYAANGMKWEKSIETFCRWSLYYDLYIKMTIFGDLIRHADDDIPTSKRGPQSLLALLPAEFTVEDARRVRLQQGMDAEHTITMIRNWKSRHFVYQISDISFKKSTLTKKNGTDNSVE